MTQFPVKSCLFHYMDKMEWSSMTYKSEEYSMIHNRRMVVTFLQVKLTVVRVVN